MRIVVTVAVVAFVGAIATMILYFTGTTAAAPVSLVLGFLFLTSGVTALMWHLQAWGVPGDRD